MQSVACRTYESVQALRKLMVVDAVEAQGSKYDAQTVVESVRRAAAERRRLGPTQTHVFDT